MEWVSSHRTYIIVHISHISNLCIAAISCLAGWHYGNDTEASKDENGTDEETEAGRLYKLAVEQGDAAAQFKLGELFSFILVFSW